MNCDAAAAGAPSAAQSTVDASVPSVGPAVHQTQTNASLPSGSASGGNIGALRAELAAAYAASAAIAAQHAAEIETLSNRHAGETAALRSELSNVRFVLALSDALNMFNRDEVRASGGVRISSASAEDLSAWARDRWRDLRDATRTQRIAALRQLDTDCVLARHDAAHPARPDDSNFVRVHEHLTHAREAGTALMASWARTRDEGDREAREARTLSVFDEVVEWIAVRARQQRAQQQRGQRFAQPQSALTQQQQQQQPVQQQQQQPVQQQQQQDHASRDAGMRASSGSVPFSWGSSASGARGGSATGGRIRSSGDVNGSVAQISPTLSAASANAGAGDVQQQGRSTAQLERIRRPRE